jgi:NADPH:quinone reductase-like Zn-dependent oxidoreductase
MPGGYAELVTVPRVNVFPKPAKLSFDEAACLPLVFLTAHHMLVRRAQLQAGETVLVLGAGSGVGSAAIQIARQIGAKVIATAGSDAKLERARALGASEVINHEKEDMAQAVKRITGGRGANVVFEHVGQATWKKSLASLAFAGRLVTCGATTGPEVQVDLRFVFFKNQSILGSTMGTKAEMFEILRWVEAGQYKPVLDRVMPLSQARAAQAVIQDRAQFGKVVLNP